MYRKYDVDDNFFSSIDSEIKAYLLGFFLADGTYCLGARCTTSYKFGVTLQLEDEEIIKMFQEFIVPSKDINYKSARIDKKGVKHKATSGIYWTSKLMAKDLESFNITPRKTFDTEFEFPFERIPDEFIWDFIRGFFDGDGQISYSETTHAATFAIYGTSFKFMNQIGDMFEKEFNVSKRVEGVKKRDMILYTLRFSANFHRAKFIRELYTKFYSNKKYFMKRKQEKMMKYLLFKYRDNSEDCERLQNIVERRE